MPGIPTIKASNPFAAKAPAPAPAPAPKPVANNPFAAKAPAPAPAPAPKPAPAPAPVKSLGIAAAAPKPAPAPASKSSTNPFTVAAMGSASPAPPPPPPAPAPQATLAIAAAPAQAPAAAKSGGSLVGINGFAPAPNVMLPSWANVNPYTNPFNQTIFKDNPPSSITVNDRFGGSYTWSNAPVQGAQAAAPAPAPAPVAPAPAPAPTVAPQAPTPLVPQGSTKSPYEDEILKTLRDMQTAQPADTGNAFSDGYRAAQNIKLSENAQGFKARKSSAKRAGKTTKGTAQFRIRQSEGSNRAASGLNIGY